MGPPREVTLVFHERNYGLRLVAETIRGAALIVVAEVIRGGAAEVQQRGVRDGMVLTAINHMRLEAREAAESVQRRLQQARLPLSLTFGVDDEVDAQRSGLLEVQDFSHLQPRSPAGLELSGFPSSSRGRSRSRSRSRSRRSRSSGRRAAEGSAVPDKKRRSALAVRKHVARRAGELSFDVGETLLLSKTLAQPSELWWKGRIKGEKKRKGTFKQTYVQEIGADRSQTTFPDTDSSDSEGENNGRMEPRSASPLAKFCVTRPAASPRGRRPVQPPPLPTMQTPLANGRELVIDAPPSPHTPGSLSSLSSPLAAGPAQLSAVLQPGPLGLQLDSNASGRSVVVGVTSGANAEALRSAGVAAGCEIVSVDGASVEARQHLDVVQLLQVSPTSSPSRLWILARLCVDRLLANSRALVPSEPAAGLLRRLPRVAVQRRFRAATGAHNNTHGFRRADLDGGGVGWPAARAGGSRAHVRPSSTPHLRGALC